MKLSLALAMILAASPAFAEGDWPGPKDPPVKPETPVEPEKPVVVQPPPPPVFITQPRTPVGVSDSDAVPQSRPLPCCIKAGELVPLWELFATPEGTLRRCERAMARGDALIYECAGAVSPEVVK